MDRRTYIGGSDAAAILGMSPWRTALEVYHQKIGEQEEERSEPPRDRQLTLLRGQFAEPFILKMVEAMEGLVVTKRSSREEPNRHVDEEHDFMAAEVDFEWEVTPAMQRRWRDWIPESLIGTVQNGEIKSMHWRVAAEKLGDAGTEDIPIEYHIQAMHGLMVTRRQLCIVPVAVGYDPLIYWCRRDDQVIEEMRDREVRFWLDHVLARVPPEPVNVEDDQRLLRRRQATKLDATPTVAALVRTLRTLRDRARITGEAIEAVEHEIGLAMLGAPALENPSAKEVGKHMIMIAGRPELTISLQHQTRIDNDALREKYPDIARELSKQLSFYKYDLRRTKP